MADLALFNDYPQLASSIPHISLGSYPTPIESLANMGAKLQIPNLYIKRDDISADLYGGNKARKLEFLMADAMTQGYQKVWTIGAIGSHHVLATCIHARELGLEPAAMHFPQPITPHVHNVLKALCSTRPGLKLLDHKTHLPAAMIKIKIKEWLEERPDVYYIPGGGSSVIGVLGYVNAALELRTQIASGVLDEPDYIFVAAGTCGTLAGLILGCKMAGLKTQVIGVRVVDKVIANAPVTAMLANRCATLLQNAGIGGDTPKIRHQDVVIRHAYLGPGYGKPTPGGLDAMTTLKDADHIQLDPTYTAKAFHALVNERNSLELHDKTVLYWHTLNSVDLSERIAQAAVEWDLPPEYRQFFNDA